MASRKAKKPVTWKCKHHGLRAHTIFINYRVWCGHHLSQKIFWCLEGEKLGNGQPLSAFLDHYCLNEGEDWQNGFLNGLNYASLLVLLVQEDLLDNIKHNSTKWQDNVLLEYEAALAKKELGEAMIYPVWVGKYTREESRGVEPLTRPYDMFDATAFPDGPHALSDGSKGKNVRETMSKLFALKNDGIFLDPENFHVAVKDIVKKAEEADAFKRAWRLKQQALSNSAWVVLGSDPDDESTSPSLYAVDLAEGTAECVARRVREHTCLVAGEEETFLLSSCDSLHVACRANTGKSANIPAYEAEFEIGELKAAGSNGVTGLVYGEATHDEGTSTTLAFVKIKDGSQRVEVKDDSLPSDISHIAHVKGNTFAVFGSEAALVTLDGGAVTVAPLGNSWGTNTVQAVAIINADAYVISGVGTLWKVPLVKGAKAEQKGATGTHELAHLLLNWNQKLVSFAQDVSVIDLETGASEIRLDQKNAPGAAWSRASSACMYKSADDGKESKKGKAAAQ